MNLNHQNWQNEEGDTRPVGFFQMVNSIAGQSVDLAHPDDPENDDEELPPALEKLLQVVAERIRDSAQWN